MCLSNGTLPWSWIDPAKALPWVEQKTGLSLAESQVAAIRLALMSNVLVITGGPAIVNAILSGTQPRTLQLDDVIKPLPGDWDVQTRLIL